MQGIFILRIEDTDAVRSAEQYTETLQQDLHWLGIAWQEGPGVDGKHGPYWQLQRLNIYHHYYDQLKEKSRVYPCFCTEEELALARKMQLSRGHAPRYSGTCRQLIAEEITQRKEQGLKPTLRFRVPENTMIEFIDLVKGPQHFNSNDIGDFIIRRADGTSPFLFCNAIDDATMKVTHVLRGDDHLTNTPRQIMILQALNLPISHYGHLSLITGSDGTPLSKRHGSFSVQDLQQRGFLPQAVINYLARLGHTCDAQQLLSFSELAAHFNVEKLSRSPAHFDHSQLMYWQKTAALLLDKTEFWHWLGEGIQRQVPEAMHDLFVSAVQPNIAFPHEAAMWAATFFSDSLKLEDLNDEALAFLRDTKEQFFVEAEQAVINYGTNFQRLLVEMKQTLGLSGKRLFMPLRIALTGRMDGPELALIAPLLGTKPLQQRFSQALKFVAELSA